MATAARPAAPVRAPKQRDLGGGGHIIRAYRAVVVVLVALSVLALPAAAGAHTTAEAHMQEDAVALKTASEERALTSRTQAATAADANAAAPTDSEGEVGSWSAPVDWPVVAVHAALLPNGKVLAYDSLGDRPFGSDAVHDHTRATIWDPRTGRHTDVRVDTGFNLFGSGLAHLLDGSVFVAGGNKDSSLHGTRETHVFDPPGNTWTRGAE
ncbi:MAG: hypothetical protein LC808_08440, partial [Actinobacteria bacterium]|nr:hypothetical protein [Actinomycetota bacterium]